MLSFLNNFLSNALVSVAMQKTINIYFYQNNFIILTQMFVHSNNNELVSFKIIAMQLCYDCVWTRKKRKQFPQGLDVYGIEIRICICLDREEVSYRIEREEALSCIWNLNAVMIDNMWMIPETISMESLCIL